MKISFAVMASIFMHLGLLLGLEFFAGATSSTHAHAVNHRPLNIIFEKKYNEKKTSESKYSERKFIERNLIEINTSEEKLCESKKVEKKIRPTTLAVQATIAQKNDLPNNFKQTELIAVSQSLVSVEEKISDHYFSTTEVDLTALPINNIDASMLPENMQNSEIKLRIFIDEFGKVVNIESIKSQLYQNETIESALTKQLYKVRFTPAKRYGSDVKSFQEVAYSFNLNSPFNHTHQTPEESASN